MSLDSRLLDSRQSLAGRFLLAMVLVALLAGATVTVVGLVLAPSLFHDRLHEALPAVPTSVLQKADEAFWSANAIGVAFAVPAALLAALGASYLLSSRLRRATEPLARAAAEVAAGDYDVRVPMGALGGEFDELIASFNDMAARLERSEESRRRLVADVAHELRTPLATLSAYIEGLEDGIVAWDAPTRGVLRAQTARLGRLAEDMASVSLADEQHLSVHRQRVAPSALVRIAAAAFRERFARKGVSLQTAARDDLPAVEVDPDRMGQALSNLLDNALRHTPAGGSVTVSAQARMGAIELTVTDSGEGIEPQHLVLIFERFYRVDAARNRSEAIGSGIGLAIVKRIVETHGGRVLCTSEGPGQGSAFVITLPPVN